MWYSGVTKVHSRSLYHFYMLCYWKNWDDKQIAGADPEISKILGFRWSKKAKITLETISFWQNISISIFKFSPFLYTMKACQWNLINFSKFANALIRKEKKHLRKFGLCFIRGCFIKSFNMMINRKLMWSPFFAFEYQDDARNIKRGSTAQITSTEVFEFIAGLVFELLSHKFLFINKKHNGNC